MKYKSLKNNKYGTLTFMVEDIATRIVGCILKSRQED